MFESILYWCRNEIQIPFKELDKYIFNNLFKTILISIILFVPNFLLLPNIILSVKPTKIYLNMIEYEIKKGRMSSIILKSKDNLYKSNRYRINCSYLSSNVSNNICNKESSIIFVAVKGYTIETKLFNSSTDPANIVVETIDYLENGKKIFVKVSDYDKKLWNDSLLLPIYFIRVIWSLIFFYLFIVFFRKYNRN